MLEIKRKGPSGRELASLTRDIPARVIPYAASSALTAIARLAQREIIRVMPVRFDRPTRFTLNSTRIVPSRVDTLTARVAVKDRTGGLAPERYLYPQVFGGTRSEKAFERALRYSGNLLAGEYALPGAAAPLDAHGNIQRAQLTQVLRAVAARPGTRGGRRAAAGYFAGTVAGTRGVWRRDGRRVRPVLIFTRDAPTYGRRFDFAGIARQLTQAEFPSEFARAAQRIVNKRR